MVEIYESKWAKRVLICLVAGSPIFMFYAIQVKLAGLWDNDYVRIFFVSGCALFAYFAWRWSYLVAKVPLTKGVLTSNHLSYMEGPTPFGKGLWKEVSVLNWQESTIIRARKHNLMLRGLIQFEDLSGKVLYRFIGSPYQGINKAIEYVEKCGASVKMMTMQELNAVLRDKG